MTVSEKQAEGTRGRNPFSVQTPEDLSTDEAISLFVDVFSDFHKVREPGHSMVNGPRGCGKSMMFRYLLPDCQTRERGVSVAALPFLGIPVSVKQTNLSLTELQRFRNQPANFILNEHLLVTFIAARTFHTLARLEIEDTQANRIEARAVVSDAIARLRAAGGRTLPDITGEQVSEIFDFARSVFDEEYLSIQHWLRRSAFASAPTDYSGALCGYMDFYVPLVQRFRRAPFAPRGPIFLLIDDADYLNLAQTRVLNSWMATRTSGDVSIKITTQLRYKTMQTVAGELVESPHDFYAIDVTDIYTTVRGRYLDRVTEIVAKRLESFGIAGTPETFFPVDEAQEKAIVDIGDALVARWEEEGRGFRPRDDRQRYARPTFIASLRGARKAGSSYSYSGFRQLVHISSGLVRYFLEAAANMYAREAAVSGDGLVATIPPATQDLVVREEANRLMLDGFEKILEDSTEARIDDASKQDLMDSKQLLRNVISVLGAMFQAKLLSNDAERRVFSIAFIDDLPDALREAFRLGVQYGYFQRSSIGNKDGTGRTPLYILTRRLAPYFTLDPTGFAGYLHMRSSVLLQAALDPSQFSRKLRANGIDSLLEDAQIALFPPSGRQS